MQSTELLYKGPSPSRFVLGIGRVVRGKAKKIEGEAVAVAERLCKREPKQYTMKSAAQPAPPTKGATK